MLINLVLCKLIEVVVNEIINVYNCAQYNVYNFIYNLKYGAIATFLNTRFVIDNSKAQLLYSKDDFDFNIKISALSLIQKKKIKRKNNLNFLVFNEETKCNKNNDF